MMTGEPDAPQGVRVLVDNVELPHTLVYEGIAGGIHRWMLRVLTPRLPNPASVQVEMDVLPARTEVELFWEET